MPSLRETLSGDGPLFGAFNVLPDPLAAETLARAGCDFVVVDLQHGGINDSDVIGQTQAIELAGAAPVARLAWNDPPRIMRALDLGATAVIVPMIDTPDQARAAALAARYPPRGNRSYGMTRPRHGGQVEPANDDVVCLPMIETAQALDNLEEIASAPGVDGLFVGPVDLALSLGHGLDLEMRRPEILDAIDRCVEAAGRHGGIVGTVASSTEHGLDLLGRGVRMISLLQNDRGLVAMGAAAGLRALRGES